MSGAVGVVAANSGATTIYYLFVLVIVVVEIAGMWKVFTKAGVPGWGAIVPFYNLYLLCKIAGRPGWWWALGLIPFVGGLIWFVLSAIVSLDIAKNFAKGTGFGVGLWLLGFVFYPILGFGDASYSGGSRPQPVPGPYAAGSQWTQMPTAAPTGSSWAPPSTAPPWAQQSAPAPQAPPPPPPATAAPQASPPQAAPAPAVEPPLVTPPAPPEPPAPPTPDV